MDDGNGAEKLPALRKSHALADFGLFQPPMSRPHRACSPLVTAMSTLLLAAACSHRATDRVQGAVPLPEGVERLRIELENGTLDVATIEEGADPLVLTFAGGVRMDAADDGQLQQLVSMDHHLVGALDPEDPAVFVLRGPSLPAGLQGMIAYEGHVRVPASMPVQIDVANNGHVTLVGRRAATEVHTGRGDLRFEQCVGAVKATTGQGNVIAYEHRGDLDVRSQGGDMQAFVNEPGERLTLSTGKGTVQCHVPPDLECHVDARAVIGRIGSDFDFEVVKPTAYSSEMVGSRGGAKTRVLLRTASGHIAVRKLEAR